MSKKNNKPEEWQIKKAYKAWDNMRQRVRTRECYKQKGIEVDPAFLGPGSFADFLAEVGYPPTKDVSLDRIDNSKGYIRGNLRWATIKIQANNKETNHLVYLRGIYLTIAQLSDLCGLEYPVMYNLVTQADEPIEHVIALYIRIDFGE